MRDKDEPDEARVISGYQPFNLGAQRATVKGHGTVTALRELIVDREPDSKGDLDQFVLQIQKLSDDEARVIGAGGIKACLGLGIRVGDLEDSYVKALATGTLEDRHRRQSERSGFWIAVGSVVLAAVLAFIVARITAS